MEIWLKYSLWLSQYDGFSEMSVGISIMFEGQIEKKADEKEGPEPDPEEFGSCAQRSRSPQPLYWSSPSDHISGMLWGAFFKYETTMSLWCSALCLSAVRELCKLKHFFFFFKADN